MRSTEEGDRRLAPAIEASKELIALSRTLAAAEAARDARLEAQLSEIAVRLRELRALGSELRELVAGSPEVATPRPLDIPEANPDNGPSLVDMRPD